MKLGRDMFVDILNEWCYSLIFFFKFLPAFSKGKSRTSGILENLQVRIATKVDFCICSYFSVVTSDLFPHSGTTCSFSSILECV